MLRRFLYPLAWYILNDYNVCLTVLLAGVGYPIHRIADALFHDEIEGLKAKVGGIISEQLKGLTQKIPKAEGAKNESTH